MKVFLLTTLFFMSACASLFAQDDNSVAIDTTFAEDYDTSTYEEEDYGYEYSTEYNNPNPSDLETTQRYKNEEVTKNAFEEKEWQKVTGGKDYSEEKEKEKEKKNTDAENNIRLPNQPWNSPALSLVAYVILGAIIAAIFYFLLKNISMERKLKKEKFRAEDMVANIENIEDLDFQKLLQHAMQEKNLRLAVRLYYLRLLQTLNNHGIIKWKKDKTNHEYLLEVFAKNVHYPEVNRLTLAYEEVWYGEHELTQRSFQDLTKSFELMEDNLKTISQE